MLEQIIHSLPSDVRQKTVEHLRQRVLADRNAIAGNAKAIAADNRNKEYGHIEGVGRMAASIDSRSYHYWAHKEPGCWNDKQFVKGYLRDCPEARTKTKSQKIQVGFDGDGFVRHRVGRKVKVY